MKMRGLLLAAMLAASPALAGELRFGLSDPQDVERIERLLNDILVGPEETTTLERGSIDLDSKTRDFLDSDPALEEAFRVNPKDTIKLIDLIQDAGGLAQ